MALSQLVNEATPAMNREGFYIHAIDEKSFGWGLLGSEDDNGAIYRFAADVASSPSWLERIFKMTLRIKIGVII